MTVHRARCEDCPWSFEDEDLLEVSDEMERHARKEMHDVDLQRAVATDGGFEHVLVPKHGHKVYHDPDPDDSSVPKCDRADVARHEWRRRDPHSLADHYDYCKFCDPDHETRRGYAGGPTLAKALSDKEIDERVDERLVTDGGRPSVNSSGGTERCADGGVLQRLGPCFEPFKAQPPLLEGRSAHVTIGGFTRILTANLNTGKQRSDEDVRTDGGHTPGAATGNASPPTRGRTWLCEGCDTPFGSAPDIVTDAGAQYCSLACYFEDVEMLGSEVHQCDLCKQVFDGLGELADHDCEPPADVIVDDAGGDDGVE